MGFANAIERFVNTVQAFLRIAIKAIGVAVGVGFVVLLFGVPTYNNLTAGHYLDAIIGAIFLLLIGAGVLYWLYRRSDVGMKLPWMSATSEE